MQKTFNFFYAFLLAILGFGATLMAEDITLTTYYPAPYGAYDELSTTGNTFLGTNAAGNIGIGTTTATRKLTIIGGAIRPAVGSTSQTGLYFPTDPGGGSGDEAYIRYYVESGENTKFMIGTNNDADDDISFYQMGAERMNIYNGNVGIGITTPGAQLHTTGTVRFANFGAGVATFDASGNITSVSDERLKDIQGNFTTGLDKILKITPILYKYNKLSGLDTENIYAGFSAQNVMKYIPEAVGENKDGYYSFNDRPVIAALVNAVKELQKEIDELKAKLDTRQ